MLIYEIQQFLNGLLFLTDRFKVLKFVQILLLEHKELLPLLIHILLFEEVNNKWLITVVNKVNMMTNAMIVAGRTKIEQLFRG